MGKIITDKEIKDCQFVCFLNNPKYPFAWTEGFAKAYLRHSRWVEEKVNKYIAND